MQSSWAVWQAELCPPDTSRPSALGPGNAAGSAQRDFVGVIKCRIWRWEDYTGISGWPIVITGRQVIREELEDALTEARC